MNGRPWSSVARGPEEFNKDIIMKKLLLLVVSLWSAGAYGIWYWTDPRTQRVTYRIVPIKRSDIGSTINTTGTIEPEEVVDVGVEVAGRIESFATDPRNPKKTITFGSQVEQGTVLARLDSALFQARVDQSRGRVAKARADIEQAQAKHRQANREMDRCRKLMARGTVVIAAQEYDEAMANDESARAALEVTQGALAVAMADLEEATVNLGYTTIRSPVNGIILDRRFNVGQIVVASVNAPSLFLIAKDLSRLEIWSSVNETDIGSIHAGQKVTFTVSALPRDTFEGKVSQIRLNASMAQNVVTYTVVIAVDNSSGRLLPYLTARLQFEVETRKGVLSVPNAALRWQPDVQNIVPNAREEIALLLSRRMPARGGAARTVSASRDEPTGLLWIRQGDLVLPIKVRIGLSDGLVTEIFGDDVAEGMEIVVGANRLDSEPDALSILPHTWSEPPKK
jgi:HlyD family secretion protein